MQDIQIEAVMDNIPELTEMFMVSLLEPTELGRLNNDFTEAAIEILPNQDPNGVLELTAVGVPLLNGAVSLEESIGFVDYEVTRTSGTFGEVTVEVATTSAMATSANGM